jgi:protein TonB
VAQPIPEQPTVRTAIHYPGFAEQQQIEGKVTLSITIMPDGSVRDVRVVNAAPRGVFEDSAMQSVSRWRYKPSGVIRTNVIVQIDFVLS